MDIGMKEMASYRKTAARRMAQEAHEIARRREMALQTARAAAAVLKDCFGATKVYVFGSVLSADRFGPWSDLDLAAWGLTPENWLKASAAIRSLCATIEVNMVDVEACAHSLLGAIERDGIPL